MDRTQLQFKNELNRLELLDLNGESNTRKKINKALLIVNFIISSFLIALIIFFRKEDLGFAYIQFAGQVLATVFFIGAIKEKFWGYALACFIGFFTPCAFTYLNPNHYSDLITLYSGMAILICTNQFYKKGFIVSSLMITCLTIIVYIMFPSHRYPHEVASTIFNSLALGSIPLFLQVMARSINTARKEELYAEIVALENQELIQSLGDFYKTQSLEEQSASKKTTYTSPYGVTS